MVNIYSNYTAIGKKCKSVLIVLFLNNHPDKITYKNMCQK